jgi:hypothetical protein
MIELFWANCAQSPGSLKIQRENPGNPGNAAMLQSSEKVLGLSASPRFELPLPRPRYMLYTGTQAKRKKKNYRACRLCPCLYLTTVACRSE